MVQTTETPSLRTLVTRTQARLQVSAVVRLMSHRERTSQQKLVIENIPDALDQGQGRGVPPSAIEDTIQNGKTIDDYRAGHLILNSLIQRIEGAGGVMNSDRREDAVSMILLEMEQINADVLNAGTKLSEKDKSDLEKFLLDIEELIARFERELPTGDEV